MSFKKFCICSNSSSTFRFYISLYRSISIIYSFVASEINFLSVAKTNCLASSNFLDWEIPICSIKFSSLSTSNSILLRFYSEVLLRLWFKRFSSSKIRLSTRWLLHRSLISCSASLMRQRTSVWRLLTFSWNTSFVSLSSFCIFV